MNSPEVRAVCCSCGQVGISEGHQCLPDRMVAEMHKAFGRRSPGLGDEWLADVIARLRTVELTHKQALDLISVITTRTRP